MTVFPKMEMFVDDTANHLYTEETNACPNELNLIQLADTVDSHKGKSTVY